MPSNTEYRVAILMFAGYMCGKFPELGIRTEQELIQVAEEFCKIMLPRAEEPVTDAK